MSGIRTAIVLAAGAGSRLRELEPYKPLCRVGGKPLIDYAIHNLAGSGIERVIVVTGYGAEVIEEHLESSGWPLEVEIAATPDWRLPNGVSARAATPLLKGEPALMVMCDHLVDPALYERVRLAGAGEGLRLGIDRRLGHPWVDPDDVTCVRTQGDNIVAIGKGLEPHDAYDTGVFALAPAFFEEIAAIEAPSVSEAVLRMADRGAAKVVDCSDLRWIDIDDKAALEKAERAKWAKLGSFPRP
jgi:choline kinase